MPAQGPPKRTCAINTDTPRGLHQEVTDTPPRRHQITTDLPPIRPAEPRHNTPTTHNQHHETGDRPQAQCPDMTETPSKHHDDTHRYPQPDMSPTFCNANPKVPKMSQNEAETAKHEPNCSASQKFRHLYNFHFHTLFIMFIRSKFPLMPLGMPCTSACAAP